MIPCQEREDLTPLCPHCNSAIQSLWCRRVASVFGKRYIYFCAQCLKVLGVSHRKGFWMG
jgi:hypothetical protein